MFNFETNLDCNKRKYKYIKDFTCKYCHHCANSWLVSHVLSVAMHSRTHVLYSVLLSGLRSLVYDNITEHPSTINILARMNIYQEVFLAFLYRTVPFIKVIFICLIALIMIWVLFKYYIRMLSLIAIIIYKLFH